MLENEILLNSIPRVKFSGDSKVKFSGVSFSLKAAKKNVFLLLMDDEWEKGVRKRFGQYEKSIESVLEELKSKRIFNIIVNKKHDKSLFKGFNVFFVDSTKDFFYSVGGLLREHYAGSLIAVTGSAGKTTTKNMLAHVLASIPGRNVSYTIGNRNTARPVVTDLINSSDSDFLALEVSRACFDTFDKYAFSLRPDFAILTSISEAHLEDLGSLEGVAIHKSKIFKNMNSGYAVVNADTPYSNVVADYATRNGAKVVFYGKEKENPVSLVKYDSMTGLVTANVFGQQMKYSVGPYSEHLAVNSLAVAAVLHLMNIPKLDELMGTLEGISPTKGRGDTFEYTTPKRSFKIIDDSYNSNPASMRASLKTLYSIKSEGGRKIAVLGDMLELGVDSSQIHSDLHDAVISSGVDKVYLVGEHMQNLWIKLPEEIKGALFKNTDGVYTFLKSQLKNKDIVLFKSSHGTELHRIVERFRKSLAS
ncbi:MAG: UDP-N-acetylmuramoyl-tripeptide--D-alanyl-D-alanine ligase [Halomonas sp.]|nr:UDP-N-acetylmuramoyl-tripeptide--D-alanyl-D-alanine ligase [Halomonas sp.]MCC5903054.1 UDP-N-acetylmuramoyl-tripeptide--D-alanyl-D-alanine ligase [Halomonas sp.]